VCCGLGCEGARGGEVLLKSGESRAVGRCGCGGGGGRADEC